MNHFNQDILKQMIERCEQEVKFAIVDKKGIGKERKRVLQLLKDNNLEIIFI